MIYRRPIRDVVEERHGRTCGLHVFVFYILALTAVCGISLACLGGTSSGYFLFKQSVGFDSAGDDVVNIEVNYKTNYGWKTMCSRATATWKNRSTGQLYNGTNEGCFDLDEPVPIGIEALSAADVPLAAGSTMTTETGLAVAFGQAVAAAVSLLHAVFFSLLYFNIEPVPIRGYLYMRGLGLTAALCSFYLLFTCVVSLFFGVKGSLDVNMETSSGLRPSWSYIITVINVTIMVIVGMLACQDDEVDAAIATPQYTSSSRNEDTVKRANGKLVNLRSRSSDTLYDVSTSGTNVAQAPTSSAPKVGIRPHRPPRISSNRSANPSGRGHFTRSSAAIPMNHPTSPISTVDDMHVILSRRQRNLAPTGSTARNAAEHNGTRFVGSRPRPTSATTANELRHAAGGPVVEQESLCDGAPEPVVNYMQGAEDDETDLEAEEGSRIGYLASPLREEGPDNMSPRGRRDTCGNSPLPDGSAISDVEIGHLQDRLEGQGRGTPSQVIAALRSTDSRADTVVLDPNGEYEDQRQEDIDRGGSGNEIPGEGYRRPSGSRSRDEEV